MPALINTLIITVIALVIAVPLGIFSAIYLVEYAKKGSKTVNLIRITAETLQGIPSIIYGLFGLLFFSTALKWGYSILSGSMTLVIMILPLIIRTTEEALLGVPDAYREASFGLGAGKLRTVFRRRFQGYFLEWFWRQAELSERLQHSCIQREQWRRYHPALWDRDELWQFICMCFPVKVFIWIRHMQLRWYFCFW